MITFPNAKINLGLRVLASHTDGYHEIETCLYPIALCDVLEIIKSDTFSFQSSGLKIEGDPHSNLVVKAYKQLKVDNEIQPVSIHLHKVIPMGAGLGGGSADGAFALKMLNEIFELQLPTNQLQKYASRLGSDCPFFIDNIPAIATGRGIYLQPIELNLGGYRIELRHVDVQISTAEAYELVNHSVSDVSLEELLKLPVDNWQRVLKNSFEESIFRRYPKIRKVKNKLIEEGAIYASMTGSGSSIFGLFK